jgi:membrane protein DedA with SNARE-associated domain
MLEELAATLTNPSLWLVVLVWVAIGVINKTIYYEAGERSGIVGLENIHGYTQERADRFFTQYDRWGTPLLLLASVPVYGSVISVLAGLEGVAMVVFIVLVAISNLVRNWLIIILASSIVQLFQ